MPQINQSEDGDSASGSLEILWFFNELHPFCPGAYRLLYRQRGWNEYE
jgi:hypothetical protein